MNREFILSRAISTVEDIIEAYENNNLYDYIQKENVEVKRSTEGRLSKIVFQVSSPYIYLDFDGEYKGRIVALGYPPDIEVSPIQNKLWFEIKVQLEGILND